MKVGVYAICKNEIKFLENWLKNCKEADYIVVLDTGSTDGTYEELLKSKTLYPNLEVFKEEITPWRFDTARNRAMELLPKNTDIFVSYDLDEIFEPNNWVDNVKKYWVKGTNTLRYFYVWSHTPAGNPNTCFWYEKIHSNEFKWVKPVHEVLSGAVHKYSEKVPELELTLHHWPDSTKSRGNYLPLLEQSVIEEPNDDRNSHYLGREYMYYGMWDKAIKELKRHLQLPSARWNAERCASMRFLARCYESIEDTNEAKKWAIKAVAECSLSREPWYELSALLNRRKEYVEALGAGLACINIKERPDIYISSPEAWGPLPYNEVAMAYYYLGDKVHAKLWGIKAFETAEEDRHKKLMKDNLKYYQ